MQLDESLRRHRRDQSRLIGEMPIGRGGADARAPGHLPQREPFRTLLGNQLQGCVGERTFQITVVVPGPLLPLLVPVNPGGLLWTRHVYNANIDNVYIAYINGRLDMSNENTTGWAVVTGASSGLGALFAEKLAQRGLPLVLSGRDEARLDGVRRRIRELAPDVEVDLVVADLAGNAGVQALLDGLTGRDIDILVNNAGFGTYGPLADVDPDRDRDLVAVNVDALVRLTHAVLPGMLARGHGRILNVASTIAFQPGPYQATYGASKAFVLSFSQALWAETRGSGVTVTALCPGATRTGFVDALDADVSHTAIYQRLAAPEPVVEAGLRALDRGQPVMVTGLQNKLTATASRLSPGWVAALIAARMLRPRGSIGPVAVR